MNGTTMAKDYLADLLSQSEGGSRSNSRTSGHRPSQASSSERTIRNITVPPHRGLHSDANRTRQSPGSASGEERKGRGPQKRIWIWAAALLALLILGAVALLAFRDTTVTVIPVSRAVIFNETSRFTAYPEGNLGVGALSYTVSSIDIEDSKVVPSSGSEQVSERASGTITVYNDYSSASVQLLKNTRFATPDGLIFRTPAAVVIPGKRGSTPGSVAVTVFADEAGDKYNVGPVAKFTLPGLKSNADMFARVYARSQNAMSGGFVGSRPSTAPGALDAARAEIRGQLESKARDSARALASTTATVFPDLMRITYVSLTPTAEAGGGVRIHEKAHVEIPVLSASSFAGAVARMAGADTENATIVTADGEVLTATPSGTTSSATLGEDSFDFAVRGTAQIVWNVDVDAVASALAGRDQSAFQEIIKGFPNIQEARARIEPFWKGTFPQNPSDINIETAAAEPVK